MTPYLIKLLITAGLVVAVSELSKRSTLLGAVLASLPMTSLLAFVWLHAETGDGERIARLSVGIFWLVLPSLVLFLVLPLLLRAGFGFWLSLAIACGSTALAYWVMVTILARFGVAV